MPNELLTTNQTAQRLKISRSMVIKLILSERLTAHKVGRDWVIEVDGNFYAEQLYYQKRTL